MYFRDLNDSEERISTEFFFIGWLYTIWAGLILVSGLLTVLVWWKGGQWREESEAREAKQEP
jgi:hypothetical protein